MSTANLLLENKEQGSGRSLRRLIWVAPLAMAAATIANTALYLGAGLAVPEVTEWAGAGIGQIMGANIVYLLVGALVLAIVNKVSSRPEQHYLIAATIGLLLSLWMPISAGLGYGPPGQPAASVATVIVLSLMHIIAYTISVPMYLMVGLRK